MLFLFVNFFIFVIFSLYFKSKGLFNMNNKKIQILIGSAILVLISSVFFLLITIKEDDDKDLYFKFLPEISIKTDKTSYDYSEKINIKYKIKNKFNKEIFVNKSDNNYYLIKKEDKKVYISLFFDEKYLKNPQKNIFINKGNIPNFRKIKANSYYSNEINLKIQKTGTFEIIFATGFNILPRNHFIVTNANYNFTNFIDKFLEWQEYVESNKIEIFIGKKPEDFEQKKIIEKNKKKAKSVDTLANNYRAAMSLNNLANKYISEKNYGEAEKYLKKSLFMIENSFGRKNKDYALILYNLGILYFHSNKIKESENFFNKSIIILEKCYKLNSPQIIKTKMNLAKFYYKTGHIEKTNKIINEQLNIIDKNETISVKLNKLKKEMELLLKKIK